MATRFNEAVQEWKSLPLTAGELGDLARLRSPGAGRTALAELSGIPPDGEVPEPVLLNAVFAAGLRVILETAEARAYAEAALARPATGPRRKSGPGSPATSAAADQAGRTAAS